VQLEQEHKESQVLKVFRVFRGQSDLKVQLVLEHKVLLELKVHKVLLVHRVHKELKVISV
jgi:hypothetical protein